MIRPSYTLSLILLTLGTSVSVAADASEPRTRFSNVVQPAPALAEGGMAGDVVAAIQKAEKAREVALATGDVKLLRELLADYYYHVETNGRVRSKAEFLQALDRGEFRFLSYTVVENEIKVIGNVAMAHGRFIILRDFGYETRKYTARFLRVWERSGTRWRNTVHQATEIKSAVEG